jgi:hypothetical protein
MTRPTRHILVVLLLASLALLWADAWAQPAPQPAHPPAPSPVVSAALRCASGRGRSR